MTSFAQSLSFMVTKDLWTIRLLDESSWKGCVFIQRSIALTLSDILNLGGGKYGGHDFLG